MKISKLMTLALAGIVMCGFGITTAQADFTLTDDNAVATIDLDGTGPSRAGMNSWTTDGVDNLFQQWFWIRIGNGTAVRLDSLTLGTHGTNDTNFDGDDDSLFAEYQGAGYTVDITWSLNGGSAGSGLSDVAEQININLDAGQSPMDFHFFQYSDFDLAGTFADDSVVLTNANTWTQTDPGGATLSETVATPAASRTEAAFFSTTRDNLDTVAGYDLDNSVAAGVGDVTWAWQWDFTLTSAGFQISKDKQIRIPAPGAALLAMLGMGMIGRIRRRNA